MSLRRESPFVSRVQVWFHSVLSVAVVEAPTNGYFTRCGPTETYGYRPRELHFPGTRQSVTGRRLGNNRVDRNDRSREHLPVASVRPLIGSYHLWETGPGRNLPRATSRHMTVVKLLRVGLSVRFTIRVSTNEGGTDSQCISRHSGQPLLSGSSSLIFDSKSS
ncbi:MAG: hypothetical protein J07HR59_00131 [Halorubrum sp. J07HR59]|nr:MAG: hypothetical protein J07HR59_00131 [Halorubrum sp. J07HR59]